MSIPAGDIRAIEAAIDLMVAGIKRLDISSLADLLTEATVLMAPERRTAKGRVILDRWRNMALAVEGFMLVSAEMQALGDRHVCDVGTMAFRRKPAGAAQLFRYMMVWQKDATDWKLASMMWNRETPANGPGPRDRPQGDRRPDAAARASTAEKAADTADDFGGM